MSSLEALEVRVENLEKDVEKIMAKSEKDSENITVIREAIVKLSTLMEKQDERANETEKRMDKQDEKLDHINQEILTLRKDIMVQANTNDSNNDDSNWFTFLNNNQKYLWGALFLLIGFIIGVNGQEILKFFSN